MGKTINFNSEVDFQEEVRVVNELKRRKVSKRDISSQEKRIALLSEMKPQTNDLWSIMRIILKWKS